MARTTAKVVRTRLPVLVEEQISVVATGEHHPGNFKV